jgi:hypothetical protein
VNQFNELYKQTVSYSVQQDSSSVVTFAAVFPITEHKGIAVNETSEKEKYATSIVTQFSSLNRE